MEKTSNTLKSYEPLLTKILINFKETRKLFRASQSVRISVIFFFSLGVKLTTYSGEQDLICSHEIESLCSNVQQPCLLILYSHFLRVLLEFIT